MIEDKQPGDQATPVVIVTQFFVPSLGGSESQIVLLASRMVRRGVPVHVIARKLKGRPKDDLIEGVTVSRVFNTAPGTTDFSRSSLASMLLASLTFGLAATWQLVLQRSHWHVVHWNGSSLPTALGAPVVKLLGGKSLAHVSGLAGFELGSLRKRFGPLALLTRPLFAMVDAFRSSGRAISEALASEGVAATRIVEIPNAVDSERFRPATDDERRRLREELGLPLERPLVAFCGRLNAGKNVAALVGAMAKLRSRCGDGPAPMLLVVGDGPERNTLLEQADGAGLGADARHWPGRVEDPAPWLRASDVFAFPSSSEGTPNAVIEAMACGLPVISTPVGTLEDLLTHQENALLVPSADETLLSDSIERLLGTPEEASKLGVAARDTVLHLHAPEPVVDRYLALYEQLHTHSAPGESWRSAEGEPA